MTDPVAPAARPLIAALGGDAEFMRWLSGLDEPGLRIHRTDDPASLARLLREEAVVALIADGDLKMDGAGLLGLLEAEGQQVPLIEVARAPSEARRAELMRRGSAWAVAKSTDPKEVQPAIRALALRRANGRARARLFDEISSRLRVQDAWSKQTQRVIEELLHELKTPAAVVQGFVSNLLDQVEGPIEPRARVALERIRAANELMVDLIAKSKQRLPQGRSASEELLGSGRRAGRRQIRLGALSREVAEVFGEMTAAKRIAVTITEEDGLPEVWGDRTRLGQLLVNLLSNAIRHTPEGGTITVHLAPAPQHKGVRITVRDSGPGVSAEHREHIFKSGFSGEGRSGLGLSIAKQVVSEHQGELVLEPPAQSGASFVITLPIDPRSRRSRTKLARLADPALVGQLLIELRERGGSLEGDAPADMEELAARLLDGGGTVILAGTLDPSTEQALRLLEGSD